MYKERRLIEQTDEMSRRKLKRKENYAIILIRMMKKESGRCL